VIDTDRRNSKALPRLDLDEVFKSQIFELMADYKRTDGAYRFREKA